MSDRWIGDLSTQNPPPSLQDLRSRWVSRAVALIVLVMVIGLLVVTPALHDPCVLKVCASIDPL